MMKKSALASLAAAAILSMAGAGIAQADPGGSVTDSLGKHAPGVVDMSADPAIRAGDNSCGNFGQYGGGFDTSLGGGWSFLAARSGPCRAASGNDGWGTGSRVGMWAAIAVLLGALASTLRLAAARSALFLLTAVVVFYAVGWVVNHDLAPLPLIAFWLASAAAGGPVLGVLGRRSSRPDRWAQSASPSSSLCCWARPGDCC